MNLTIQLKLHPTFDQKEVLLATMERFNGAATFAAKAAFDAGVSSHPDVHRIAYRKIRERFGLPSQLAVRAIGKAVEAIVAIRAKGQRKCPSFRPHGSVVYDQRNMRFKGTDRASISTLSGRAVIAMAYGEYQRERFDRIKGQCDLVYRKGQFFLYCSVVLPDGSPIEVADFLGVDMGIVQIATDSDGNAYSGEAIDRSRIRHYRNRRRLQKRGTRGAKKRLKSQSGREARFRAHYNHCIAKAIVANAKATDRGIVVEDLSGIQDRVTVRRKQRDRHSGWAFSQLRSFIEYKARLAGVPVMAVDPRNTSRTCSSCGHCEKGNRKSQSLFSCLSCGMTMNADHNAALNLRVLGLGVSSRSSELEALAGHPESCHL